MTVVLDVRWSFWLMPLRFRGSKKCNKDTKTAATSNFLPCLLLLRGLQSIVATMSSTRKSRSGKHSWSKKYHRIARKNKLQIITEAIHEEEEEQEQEEEVDFALPAKRGPKAERNRLVREYKARILCALARSEGDSSSTEVHAAIDQLLVNQSSSHFDPKKVISAHADRLEDSWISMSKPVFEGCLGLNENNEPMYTLGRMAFGTYDHTTIDIHEIFCRFLRLYTTQLTLRAA